MYLAFERGFVLFLFCIAVVLCNSDNQPTVKIPYGELVGNFAKSRGGRTYEEFKGIPYGNKPERFEEAERASAWSGVRDASNFGSMCSQFDPVTKSLIGEDDCLFVNIFTPKLDAGSSLPVIVYVYGGGYEFGKSDDYGAEFFMDQDIVLVTFNYRLGPFGFLSTGDEIIPGNIGLKDQVLALQWVQENIHHFRGNPQEVTLYGQSAGGASVGLHLVSPLSRGLFHRAICSSSATLNSWTLANNPHIETLNFARRLNCSTSSSAEIKACLKSKTAREMLTPDPTRSPMANRQFVPTVEIGKVTRPFLSVSPRQHYEKGDFAKVPLLVTVTKDEGLLFHSALIMKYPRLQQKLNAEWIAMAPQLFQYFDFGYTEAEKGRMSEAILEFYFSNQSPPVSEATFWNLTNLFSDARFIFGAWETARAHAHYDVPTYAAIFNFDGIWSFTQAWNTTEDVIGMAHADELQYLFFNPLGLTSGEFTPDSAQFEVSLRTQILQPSEIRTPVKITESGTQLDMTK